MKAFVPKCDSSPNPSQATNIVHSSIYRTTNGTMTSSTSSVAITATPQPLPPKKHVFVTSYTPNDDTLECITSSSPSSPKQIKLSPMSSYNSTFTEGLYSPQIKSPTSSIASPFNSPMTSPDYSTPSITYSNFTPTITAEACLDKTKNLSDGRSWSRQLSMLASSGRSATIVQLQTSKPLTNNIKETQNTGMSFSAAIVPPLPSNATLTLSSPVNHPPTKTMFFTSRKRTVTYNARPWQATNEDNSPQKSVSLSDTSPVLLQLNTKPSAGNAYAGIGAPGCSSTFVPPSGFMTDADMMPPPALPPPPRLFKSATVGTVPRSPPFIERAISVTTDSPEERNAGREPRVISPVKSSPPPTLERISSSPIFRSDGSDLEPVSSDSKSHISNVKDARECQERGEEQNLMDDIHYLIEGIQANHSVNARALSIHNLITKCLLWNFRRRLRNRKILERILKYMQDADMYWTLSFFVASFLYVLLRNTDASHLGSPTLSVLLKLLRCNHQPLCASRTLAANADREAQDAERLRVKLLPTLETFHKSVGRDPSVQKTLCKHVRLDRQMKVFDLMIELLLSFNNRKNCSLLKEELRMRGGLDTILDASISAMNYIGDDLGPQRFDEFVLERMKKLFYYMRLLEDVTFKNDANQEYLVKYKDQALIHSLVNCLRLCVNNLTHHVEMKEGNKLVNACLMGSLRLLLNISCDNEYTSERMGACPYLLDLAMHITLRLTESHVKDSLRTDILVICLGLMVNLAEHCPDNRDRIMQLLVSPTVNFEMGGQVCQGERGVAEENQFDETETTKIGRVSALKELVQLFTKLEQKLQEHEFEKADERSLDQTDEENDDTKGNENVESLQSTSPNAPLKFHFVEARGRQKNSGFRPSSRGRNGDDEYSASGYQPEDMDSIGGTDVEFEAHTVEEKRQLQQKLDSAEVHMQHSMVCAYLALLLGCLLQDNSQYAQRIRQLLPGHNFRLLAFMLAKLYNFLQITQAMSNDEKKSVEKILRALEAEDGVVSSLHATQR